MSSEHDILRAERPGGTSTRSFDTLRGAYDTLVFWVFFNGTVRKVVQDQSKANLESLWDDTVRKLLDEHLRPTSEVLAPLEIHRRIVKGLPGEALFISSAMVFDSMGEALELFDMSAKTAKQRIGDRLSSSESEIALRLGRVLAMAREVFGSADAAREFLRTPNFALGGAEPRDLLKTGEGELLVLSEIQAQLEGAPV